MYIASIYNLTHILMYKRMDPLSFIRKLNYIYIRLIYIMRKGNRYFIYIQVCIGLNYHMTHIHMYKRMDPLSFIRKYWFE